MTDGAFALRETPIFASTHSASISGFTGAAQVTLMTANRIAHITHRE